MKKFGFALLAVIALLLSAGALDASEVDLLPLGDPGRAYLIGSAGPGEILDTRRNTKVDVAEMVAELKDARVILLGEDHTHLGEKLLQAAILKGLVDQGMKLSLGMEFFQRGDDEILGRWGNHKINGEEFLRKVGWYDRGSYRWDYYAPIMKVARDHEIRVVGLNVPRDIPRVVNRKGLEGLSDVQKAIVGSINPGNSPQHRYLISRYFGESVAMMPPAWFDRMYAAQCLWDTVMARSILDNLRDGETMVVVVGGGHVAYDLGIARRIHEELSAQSRPDIKVMTYCPVMAPVPDPEGEPSGHPMGHTHHGPSVSPGIFAESLADFVGVFEDPLGIYAWPTVGLRLKADDEERPVVSMVWPDTRAEDMGFQSGDVILDLNGVKPADLSDLRLMLARIEWGQRLDFRILREDEEMHLAGLLIPDPEQVDTETPSGWTVEAVGDVDPESSIPFHKVAEVDAVRTRKISSKSFGSWLVVWKGDLAQEAHQLDADGRVLRSLYLEPKSDGAVQIRYARCEHGAVISITRFDREGGEIVPAPEKSDEESAAAAPKMPAMMPASH